MFAVMDSSLLLLTFGVRLGLHRLVVKAAS